MHLQSYGFGASGKVKIPVTVKTKDGEEKKECVLPTAVSLDTR